MHVYSFENEVFIDFQSIQKLDVKIEAISMVGQNIFVKSYGKSDRIVDRIKLEDYYGILLIRVITNETYHSFKIFID